jgi:hypothetical protein
LQPKEQQSLPSTYPDNYSTRPRKATTIRCIMNSNSKGLNVLLIGATIAAALSLSTSIVSARSMKPFPDFDIEGFCAPQDLSRFMTKEHMVAQSECEGQSLEALDVTVSVWRHLKKSTQKHCIAAAELVGGSYGLLHDCIAQSNDWRKIPEPKAPE